MKKQLQFELWDECNNKCSFCQLCDANLQTSDEDKLNAIEHAITKISDLELYSEYDTLGFIGGEFFQGQLKNISVKEKFIDLMKLTNWLLVNGYIKHIWINATLTIGEQRDLYDTLDIFKENIDKVWVLTSYDTMGRFHTKNMEETWSYHMKNLKRIYPEINLNITTILTGDCIEKYLGGEFSFKKIMEEYGNAFFIKVPILQKSYFMTNKEMNDKIGNFFPKRKRFIEFLKVFKENESKELWDKLFNINYRADTLLSTFNHEDIEITRNKESYMEDIKDLTSGKDILKGTTREYNREMEHIMKCGHLSSYNSYVDEDGCAMCDKQMLEKYLDF